MTTLTLPWPPSVNQTWRTVTIKVGNKFCRRTLLSEAARDYRQEVARQVDIHRAVTGDPAEYGADRLGVTIRCFPPDKRTRDLDNAGKCPLDALTHAGVWEDDSQIDRLTYERGPVEKGGRIVVTIQRIGVAV